MTGRPEMSTCLPGGRTRLGIALLSGAVIVVQLALMRVLALRFWDHFAHMVIGVALLGFGVSGVWLSVFPSPGRQALQRALCRWSWLFAVSVLGADWVSRAVPLNLSSLVWDPSQSLHILWLEALFTLPFFCAAMPLGLVLFDRVDRIPGHNAANLCGAGSGAVAAVLLLGRFSPVSVLSLAAMLGLVAGICFAPRYTVRFGVITACVTAAWLTLVVLKPSAPAFSEYKTLSLVRQLPQVKTLVTRYGVLGRIDALQGEGLHHAPGLSLQGPPAVPDHVLLCLDGDQSDAVYRCEQPADWAFLDYTTAAVAYSLWGHSDGVAAAAVNSSASVQRGARRDLGRVLAIGAGGGSQVGLARYHGARRITALEANPVVAEVVTGPLASYGGDLLVSAGVDMKIAEARGFLATVQTPYDIIQVPVMHAFGAGGAGLLAAGQSQLYTIEGIGAMIDQLGAAGVLCLTGWARTPPREGPRLFATCVAALRRRGIAPARHLAMIRNWATVTILVSRSPWSAADLERVRAFCFERGFDLCYLPDLRLSEANRFHVLDRPRYVQAAEALLGAEADAFMAEYPFRIEPVTDNAPYFHSFFRWSRLGDLRRHLGVQSRSFIDVGYVLLVAALLQVVCLAAPLLVLGLLFARGRGGRRSGRFATIGYFLGIGLGFMLFELGVLHRLNLYLAHPVYAASTAIASFLVFAGLGSLSVGTDARDVMAHAGRNARWTACAGVILALFLGPWLNLTAAWPLGARMLVAAVSVSPLAFLLGRMLPLGLALIGERKRLIPLAWAVNGFASVSATLAAPLLGMQGGFRGLILIAALCYAWVALVVPAFRSRQVADAL